MNLRPLLTAWLVAMLIGSTVAVFGAFTSSLLIPCGLALNTIACVFGLLRMRPRQTAFVAESLVLSLFTILILANLIHRPFLLITLFFIWIIVQLPLLVLGTALSEHFKAAIRLRVVLHIALIIAPISLLAFSLLENSHYSIDGPPIALAGDSLVDKSPPFIDTPDYRKSIPYASAAPSATPDEAHSLEINKSAAVVALDLAELENIDTPISQERFATYRDAVTYLEARDLPWVPSVQMVDQKVKAFSDAALAAIDLFTQREAKRLGGGRQVFLEALLKKCLANGAPETSAFVAAAAQLSGAAPTLPPDVAEKADAMRATFLADAYASKPVGFYTETEELRRVFQQNRFCQQNLLDLFAPPVANAIASDIARLLDDSTDLSLVYDTILSLQRRTTNPPGDGFTGLKGYTQKTPEQYSHIALFPPSGSKEDALYSVIYGIPDLPNENIMNRLIRAIEEGSVDLTPDENSGWYDYQVHTLETLLVPERGKEGNKLLLSKAYKARLLEAFRSILTKQRETHVGHLYVDKSAEAPAPIPAGPFIITPDISLEPTATAYLRSARALRFLEAAVMAILGEADYASITLANGETLTKALPEVAQLLYGLYFKVCEDIGMPPELLPEERTPDQIDQARAEATTWLEAPGQDKTFTADVRYIVPVMADAGHTEVRYWMTTGIRLEKAKAEYVREPRFRLNGEVLDTPYALESNGILLAPQEFYLPVEEFAEATGPSTPYTREEFRDLCDAAGSREDIVRAIESGGASGWTSPLYMIAALSVLGILTGAVSRSRRKFHLH